MCIRDSSNDGERFRAAIRDIKTYLPGIDESAVALSYAGIRPKLGKLGAVASGKGFQDFYIVRERERADEDGNAVGQDAWAAAPFINLLGIESPGLTSSLAIGEYVHDMLYR